MKKVLVAGGDRRAKELANLLKNDGYAVETTGLGEKADVRPEQPEAVLFPYPFSVRNGLIPVMTDEKLRPEDVLAKLPENTLVIAGRGMEGYIPQELSCVKRYSDAEELEVQNAELSAEAAVCEAMLHCPLALMDAKVLVTGYGLFGRAVARRLKALGTEVWVAARRQQQRQLAEEEGMRAIELREILEALPQMDLILNTVPANVLDEASLRRIPKGCWLLEMASAPYGFDMEKAKLLGISCALLAGLPARYSPLSAAKRLYEAVKPWLVEA